MPCIPKITWTNQSVESSLFRDFRVDANAEITNRLSRDLGFYPQSETSLNSLRLRVNPLQTLKPGGYALTVAENLVEVTASGLAGLHYGLSALKQLIWSQGGHLLHGEAVQNPDYENRGIMLDVSRGKMATLEYLKDLASFLSDLGYNIFQLYCEDKLALKTHPLVGSVTGAYTMEQIRDLDAWCRDCFIELQPCIQTYSHMHGLLRLPGYSSLSENDDMYSMAAGKESVYLFLEDELSETLPWFSSTTLNINMDEAFDIGTGYSKEESEKKGKGGVFLAHLRRVADIARRHGAQTIVMWGDFVAKYKDQFDSLPPNVIFADWNYHPQEHYPSIDLISEMGIPFWAAGGTSSWNSLFPRVYNSCVNLINLSSQAYSKGAGGFLVTDWGDYGHMQPLGLSLYGFMVGAQQAFSAKKIDTADFEREAWPLVFLDPRVKEGFRLLMDSNLAPDLQQGYKTMSLYAFFDDLFVGLTMRGNKTYPKLTREAFLFMTGKGSAASSLLEEIIQEEVSHKWQFPDPSWEALFGDAFIREMHLTARSIDFAGRKGLLSHDALDLLQDGSPNQDDLLVIINRIKALYAEFLSIRREFVQVWDMRAYDKGMDGCMGWFDKAGVQMGEAVKWLSAQISALRHGGQVDRSFQTYEAGKNYKILWTADFRNLWDRTYPWQ